MPCSVCNDPNHNRTTCAHAQNKRSADAASLGGSTVASVRPRVEGGDAVSVGVASIQAPGPAKPEEIFEYFDSSPASSPIGVVTKQVVPWVDYMLFQKMRRCVYFFIAKRIAKGTYLSRRLELC